MEPIACVSQPEVQTFAPRIDGFPSEIRLLENAGHVDYIDVREVSNNRFLSIDRYVLYQDLCLTFRE